MHVTLNSKENAFLPVFTEQLAVVKQGDLWVLKGDKEPLRLTSDGCNCSPAWSPDGKWLLFYKYDPAEKWNRDYSLWVARADGTGVYSIDPETQILDARWSPAANSIAYLTARQDERQRSTGFKLVQVSGEGPGDPLSLKDESEKIMNFRWFPTGEKLVYTTADPNPNAKDNPIVKVMPAGGGDAEILLSSVEKDYLPDTDPRPALSSYLGGLKFSPNKNDLSFFKYPFSASLTADGVYLYADSLDKQEPRRLATMLAYPYWVDWSPGGDLLAFIEGSGREAFTNKRLSIMPVNRPDQVLTVTPEGYIDRDPAWSPDGKHIAVSRAKSSQGIVNQREELPPASIWLMNPDGSGAKQISSDSEIPGCFDYNPWWAEGGKSLMWVRIQGEKASIWRAEPDGGDQGLIYEDPDIPQGYYGANNWKVVMAWCVHK